MKQYRFRVYGFTSKGLKEWREEAKPIFRKEWKAKSKPRYRLLTRAYVEEGKMLCMY